nr:immunoglobulin light chain junction region [Macaca mulatta]
DYYCQVWDSSTKYVF